MFREIFTRRAVVCAFVLTIGLAQAAAAQNAKAVEGDATARNVGSLAGGGETTVPRLVQFNGALKDASARPVSGVVSVTFALYAEQDGGAALWTETQNVLADGNGHFAALLGTATTGGFPAELFSAGEGASRWLGVTIARQAEMPRVLLASVPYALKAGDADTLGGRPASEYVTTQQLAARGAVVAAPSTTIVSGGAVASPGTTGTVSPDAGGEASGAITPSVTQATVTGTGTANYLPLWTSGTNLGVSKIYQANGGFIGINTNTPLLQLDVNGNSIFRGSFQLAPQGVATASTGQPSHSFQWQASLYDSSKKAAVNEAFGFRTLAATNNVAGPTAKLDLFYGPGGGTLNDTGLSISNSGLITFAPGQNVQASALDVEGGTASVTTLTGFAGLDVSTSKPNGIYVVSTDSSGVGVEGENDNGYGVLGLGGVAGVYGASTMPAASASSSYGGYFFANSETSTGGTGVYGESYIGVVGKQDSPGGWAGYYYGDLYVSGTILKSSGSFEIDHPLDPENKYLLHSFVESPDMKNVYDGVATTDASGLAVVTMPDWFEALNRDFRYQLTTIGQPAQTWIAKKIANGQFTIQTDKPNVEVSWQITGIRQDAYANAHRIPTEKEKTGAEKGHYLHPELFGHAGEASIPDIHTNAGHKPIPQREQVAAPAQQK